MANIKIGSSFSAVCTQNALLMAYLPSTILGLDVIVVEGGEENVFFIARVAATEAATVVVVDDGSFVVFFFFSFFSFCLCLFLSLY